MTAHSLRLKPHITKASVIKGIAQCCGEADQSLLESRRRPIAQIRESCDAKLFENSVSSRHHVLPDPCVGRFPEDNPCGRFPLGRHVWRYWFSVQEPLDSDCSLSQRNGFLRTDVIRKDDAQRQAN